MPKQGQRQPGSVMLDPEQRHVAPTVGAVGHTRMLADRRTINEDERTIDFVCSTMTVDRYGEVIDVPSAFRDSLSTFMTNPAFPFGHHYDASGDKPPTVGHWKSMEVVGTNLIGRAYFKPRGLGEECWLDYKEGNLNTVSVAFLTRAWEMRELDIEGDKRRVRVFTDVDLLEVSAVLIPANPEARIRAAGFGRSADSPRDDEQLEKRIETAVERSIAKCLDAGPGGHLCMLLQDVAAAVRGSQDHGIDDGDVHGQDTPEPEPESEGDHELKALLREALSASKEQNHAT